MRRALAGLLGAILSSNNALEKVAEFLHAEALCEASSVARQGPPSG